MVAEKTTKEIVEQYHQQLFNELIEKLNDKIGIKSRNIDRTNNGDKKSLSDSINNAIDKKNIKSISELIKDIEFLDSEMNHKPSDILLGIEEDLNNALPYISEEETNKIGTSINMFRDFYEIESEKRIEKLYSDLLPRLENESIKSVAIHTGIEQSQLVFLDSHLFEALERETLSNLGVQRPNVNFHTSKEKGTLGVKEKEILEKVKVICDKKINKTPGAKNINKLGYSEINNIFETIDRNKKANIHLTNVKIKLTDKLKDIPNEKNKARFQMIIETINGTIRRNELENINLQNRLDKLELNNLDKLIYDEKYFDSEVKETSSKFKSIDNEKQIDNLGNLNTIEGEKQMNLEEERKKAHELYDLGVHIDNIIREANENLYDKALEEVRSESNDPYFDPQEYDEQIHEVMQRNLRMLNSTTEERAKTYWLNQGVTDPTEQMIDDVLPTLSDLSLGIANYKFLQTYLNENLEDKDMIRQILENAYGEVFEYEREEVSNKSL